MLHRSHFICETCLAKWPQIRLSAYQTPYTRVLKRKLNTLPNQRFPQAKSAPSIFSTFFISNRRSTFSEVAQRKPAQAEDVEEYQESALSKPIPSHQLLLDQKDPYPPLDVVYKPIPPLTLRHLSKVYLALSKSRLTSLIVLTAMSGYALSPLPGSVSVLLSTALGTAFCCASANTLNQIQEIPYDAQMVRTRSRPLVRRVITPLHACGFAVVTGVAGTGLLWTFVNPLTATLGALNIALYAGLYTYLKRKSIINTWVGAIVGGIPPLMGWTACGGSLLPSESSPIMLFLPDLDPSTLFPGVIDNPLAAYTLFLLLYSWQFPHFNPLSLMLASSYARAGFRMLSVISPRRNAAVCLRHAFLLIPICSILTPLSGLTTWWFALSSLTPNIIAVRAAWQFWRTNGGLSESKARSVWRISLWWLPVMLGLMMVHKKDAQWSFSFQSSRGPNGQEGNG